MRLRVKRNIAKILVVTLLSGLVFPCPNIVNSEAADVSTQSDGELSVENGTISVDVADKANRDITVSGVVTDGSGAPSAGQIVTLEKQLLYHAGGQTKEKWFTYDSTTTDNGGFYSIKAEKSTVYRISAGKDIPIHSESKWAMESDISIDLSGDLYSLEGRVQTELGEAVPGVYITLKRIGDLATTEDSDTVDEYADGSTGADEQNIDSDYSDDQESVGYEQDLVEDSLTAWDPVVTSDEDEMMLSLRSDENGSFKYNEISAGLYRVYMGRTGVLVSEIIVDKDDFTTVVITEADATIEEYRNQILADEDRADDYGTELDLPGYMIPTPTPSPKPQETVKPNYAGKRLYDGEIVYTNYSYTMSVYAEKEHNSVPRVGLNKYLTLLDPDKDTTKGMKYLRIDEYRKVNKNEFIKLYQSMIENYCRSAKISTKKSSLYGHGADLLDAAKKYKIDPVFLATQTFHESAFGTSHLASGSTIDKVALKGYPRTAGGKFLTKKLEKKAVVYNLYGIKAYDADPYVGGTSFAYYNGWNTPKKAIYGAAEYIHDNYIHNALYKQNTAFELRFVNAISIWHQYATGPTYAEDIGRRMISMAGVYSASAKFTYDYPVFKKEEKKTKTESLTNKEK